MSNTRDSVVTVHCPVLVMRLRYNTTLCAPGPPLQPPRAFICFFRSITGWLLGSKSGLPSVRHLSEAAGRRLRIDRDLEMK